MHEPQNNECIKDVYPVVDLARRIQDMRLSSAAPIMSSSLLQEDKPYRAVVTLVNETQYTIEPAESSHYLDSGRWSVPPCSCPPFTRMTFIAVNRDGFFGEGATGGASFSLQCNGRSVGFAIGFTSPFLGAYKSSVVWSANAKLAYDLATVEGRTETLPPFSGVDQSGNHCGVTFKLASVSGRECRVTLQEKIVPTTGSSAPATAPSSAAEKYAQAPVQPQPKTILWVTALVPELMEAEAMLRKHSCDAGAPFRMGREKMGEVDFYLEGIARFGSGKRPFMVKLVSAKGQGPVESALTTSNAIKTFQPCVAVMSGVAAGLSLGDVVIASEAFSTDYGGKRTYQQENLPALTHGSPAKIWIQWLERHLHNQREKGLYDARYNIINPDALTVARPLSTIRYQAWILLAFFYKRSMKGQTTSYAWFDDLGFDVSQKHNEEPNKAKMEELVPQWPVILPRMVHAKYVEIRDDEVVVTPALYKHIQNMFTLGLPLEKFNDKPKVKIAKVLSGPQVRADGDIHPNGFNAIKEAQAIDRGVEAVEMEGCQFYQQCRSLMEKQPFFMAKGISDLADILKDDDFHDYGKQLSAVVLIDIINGLVDDDLI
eukprot:TRINITY_DN7118_c0_g1_i1.p1 TRINITY_DN7118_c0_g1~~TRINITY_DN7118_c0_g1_i1.p1  ORF type:complete len:600 (+),score=77.00 TRINITY_DN7118_c0_g1_i1:17-1816(+)